MLTRNKMLFLSIILAIIFGSVIWQFFIENYRINDVEIPASQNITYNDQIPINIDSKTLEKEFENNINKPILLYLYTTWCQVCNKNFVTFNELAREFQNTDLKVFALAIDRNVENNLIQDYFKKLPKVYFLPQILENRNGFIEFLQSKKVSYNNRIPYTILFARDGSVLAKYSGTKSKNYLRNKIITELYDKN
jgi:thiol-disulfide isomerase/thioredoxin